MDFIRMRILDEMKAVMDQLESVPEAEATAFTLPTPEAWMGLSPNSRITD